MKEEGIVFFFCDVDDVGIISMTGGIVAAIFIMVTDDGFASSDDGSHIEFIPVIVKELVAM